MLAPNDRIRMRHGSIPMRAKNSMPWYRAVIVTIDRLAEQYSDTMIEEMHRAYTYVAQLEWMFWDATYRQEIWPI